jgi:hypothetical protein
VELEGDLGHDDRGDRRDQREWADAAYEAEREHRAARCEPQPDDPVPAPRGGADQRHRHEVGGDPGTQRQPVGELEVAPVRGRLDHELEPYRGRGDACEDEQVPLRPDVARAHPACGHRAPAIEVEPPDRRCQRQAEQRREDSRGAPASLQARDRGDDGLAEHDQREEAVALGDVARVVGEHGQRRGGEHRRCHQDQHRRDPDDGTQRLADRERHQPDRGAGGVADRVARAEAASGRNEDPGARIERREQCEEGGIRDHERRRVAVRRARHADGDRADAGHRREQREAVGRVVGVERARVPGEAPPDPPDGHEQPGEDREPGQRVIVVQLIGERGDRGDQHEVEEELEPARLALLLDVIRRHVARR